MKRIGIIAALPGELKPLVAGWKTEEKVGAVRCWSFEAAREMAGEAAGETWLAACGGMGASAATRAFAAVERHGPLSSVISIGWAGGLRRELMPGVCYRVSEVVDVRTSEHFTAAQCFEPLVLATTVSVAAEREKRRLAENYNATLVDMEAATVARLARARDIPFYCFKAVTDAVGDTLPDFNRYLGTDGQLRIANFAGYAAVRPWHWPSLLRLERNGRRGAKALKASVLDFLDGQGDKRKLYGDDDSE